MFSKKTLAILLIVPLAMLGIYGASLSMHMEGHESMMDCPYKNVAFAMCESNAVQFLFGQRLLAAVFEPATSRTVLALFAFLIFSLAFLRLIQKNRIWSFADAPPERLFSKKWLAETEYKNYILRLLSAGILHPKLF